MLHEIIPQSAIVLSLVGIIVILGRKFPKVCELKFEEKAGTQKPKMKFSQRLRIGLSQGGIILGRCFKQIAALLYVVVNNFTKKLVAWRQSRRAKALERKEKQKKETALEAKIENQQEVQVPKVQAHVSGLTPESKPLVSGVEVSPPQRFGHFRQNRLPSSAPFVQRQVLPSIGKGKRTLPMHSWSIDELLTEAQKFVKLKRFDQAESLCLVAVRKNPHIARVYKILGNIYFQQGNFEDARRSFREALKRGVDEIEVYKKLGYAYVACDKYKEAVRVYRQAIKNNRAKEYFYLELGKVYRDHHQIEQAIAVYENLVREYPGNFQYIELLEKQKKIGKSE